MNLSRTGPTPLDVLSHKGAAFIHPLSPDHTYPPFLPSSTCRTYLPQRTRLCAVCPFCLDGSPDLTPTSPYFIWKTPPQSSGFSLDVTSSLLSPSYILSIVWCPYTCPNLLSLPKIPAYLSFCRPSSEPQSCICLVHQDLPGLENSPEQVLSESVF